MSHSHTHAPGETHSHSHGPPQQQQQQQMPPPPPIDPQLQAMIDADFQQVDVALSADNHSALCGAHSLEKCADCGVDYVNMNRLSRILAVNPNLLCPPPANVVSQKLSQMVTQTKDEGNTLFKTGQPGNAIKKYTAALMYAVQRPPWEANQFMREELSTVISNRSAAFLESKDYVSALADAEIVIQLKRNWSKGHFRKSKALVAMERYHEAAEALSLGLAFEPGNAELVGFLEEIQKKMTSNEEKS
ncbi:unnamed protein product [Mycena citricolor]|uniref:Translocation protein sec72 n=1 Tax=Mycena citricolor TaxID=2018698 RepID=A0AAD2H102_9AGAR|nr:unnamed protein product [Mycena citricolor]CAK5273712.1 unnamed protein product [Mycena citricolor]